MASIYIRKSLWYGSVLVTIATIISIPQTALTQGTAITQDLYLGSRGSEVLHLQQILNTDYRTRVATSGPGSLGFETDYFGPLTRDAVIRFQELYAGEILHPLGLAQGTGFVGPSTRLGLSSLQGTFSQHITATPLQNTFSNINQTTQEPSRAQQLLPTTLDEFVEVAKNTAISEGISQPKIARIEKSIREQAEIPREELAEMFLEGRRQLDRENIRTPEEIFKDIEAIKNDTTISYTDDWKNKYTHTLALGNFIGVLKNSFIPPSAHAQVGFDIGGLVLYQYLCTCSFTWLLWLGPPSIGIVDYETGTQGFMYYNLPYAGNVLGKTIYAGPTCVTEPESECSIVIPSTYGLFTPIVGTSLY